MHRPRKRFGQHFLSDQSIVYRIIDALDPTPTDHIVEIGPGQGALTIPLLRAVPKLEVVELDRDLIPELEKRSQHKGQLQIYSADALTFDFASLKQDERPLRIVGNLPYNISTPLIFHLLTFAPIVTDMLFMLQKEVAERLAGGPNSAHYGRLSVMVQYYCHVDLLFDVPRQAFFPPPQVTSSIVRLIPHRDHRYHANDETLLASIVKQAFSQRRKTLRNSLKELVDDDVWAQLNIHSDLRPESLSVKEFVEISNAVGDKKIL